MDINTERNLLIKEILQVEDILLLKAVKAVLHYGLQNEGRISVEQYNREIDEAEARVSGGSFVVHEEANDPVYIQSRPRNASAVPHLKLTT